MILLILAVLWIVVLAPGFMKRLTARRSTESIESFHHQLHLLERTGPKLVAPAYRLQTVESGTGMAPGASGFPSVTSMPGRPNLVLLRPVGEADAQRLDADEVVDAPDGGHYARVAAERPAEPEPVALGPAGPDPYKRELARRRRRDVLLVLVLTVVSSAVLGMIHSLRPLWVVTILSGLALAAYVGLIAYAQSLNEQTRRADPRRTADASARAGAGYPGAWDDGMVGTASRYDEEPRQAVGGG